MVHSGSLGMFGSELPRSLAHVVYNIKLQEGGQIELGNKVKISVSLFSKKWPFLLAFVI